MKTEGGITGRVIMLDNQRDSEDFGEYRIYSHR